MMRQRLITFALVAPILLASACGVQDLVMPSQGKVEIEVKWPSKKAFVLQTIPTATARIEVTILGEGIPGATPLHTTLTEADANKPQNFMEVPIGPKVVQAVAFDADNREIGYGEKAINVEPNKLTEAHVELHEESPDVIAPPTSPGPSSTPTPTGATPTPTVTPTPGPIIDTLAGGAEGISVDNQDPKSARFFHPRALAYDYGAQLLYIADNENHLIRRYDRTTHAVTTAIYLGAPATSENPATTGATGSAYGLVVSNDGTLYYADAEHNVIKRMRRNGDPETIAGTGQVGSDDGPGNQATFRSPVDIALGVDGKLYVADQLNNRVRVIDLLAGGFPVTTLAGTGSGGYSGDAGPADKATIDLPTAIAVHPSGAVVYVAEGKGMRVRKITLATSTIDTAVGTGISGTAGEGGPSLKAQLSLPLDLAFDGAGNLLIADGWAGHLGNGTVFVNGSASRVLRLDQDGNLVRIAGELRTANGFSGDGKDPTQAELNNPSGLAFDAQGVLYIADTYNQRIRTIVVPPPPSPTPAPPAPSATPTPAPSKAPSPAPSP